ncbi:6721_t:CDS:2, partial [Paraglomus occultum]
MPPQKPMIEELDTTGNVSADDSSSTEKKDIKEEVQSIYHRIFAERGPNKRKIKVRKIEEMPLELNGPDSDSEYQDSHDSTDTDDATIVSSELQNINSESDDAEKEEDESLSVSDTEDQSQRIKDWLTSWKVNDPGVCCICLDSATTEDNVLVYCDNDECEVVTHQECYGIIDLPGAHDPWYCDRCLAKPSECVSCCLCPNKNGAFRRLSRGADSGGWVHVVCALWMPGMWIGDNELISDITVEHVQQNNWRKSCCVCSSGLRDEGAVVHCDAGGCKNWLHVTCAQSLSLLEVVEDDPNMADPYFIYCPQHGSHAGEDPRLNAWERWYRKRDEFLLNARKKEGLARTRRVNVEDDIGMTLRELFEDRYCDYRERREQRIAQTRRRVAEGAAIVNGIKDQIVKNEQALVEISSKVESGEQERQALLAYIEEITPCLHILTKAMLRTD